MNRLSLKGIGILSLLVSVICSCAVEVEESSRSIQERVFNSYIAVHGYEGMETIEDDIYVFKREGGEGKQYPEDSTFVMANYVAKYISGEYAGYTSDTLAMLLGNYSPAKYYGDLCLEVGTDFLSDPLNDIIKTMREGERVVAVVPPWLYTDYSGPVIASDGSIIEYDITVTELIEDIDTYQLAQLREYSAKNYEGMDSLSKGFYFKKIYEVEGKEEGDTIVSGTSINIRYIGRFLDGRVFDTNIQDTAKKYGIFSSISEYTALSLLYDDDYEKIIEDASLVSGFSRAIATDELYYGEKCITFFYYEEGYGADGNGDGIPPYCPLFFEIWIEDND